MLSWIKVIGQIAPRGEAARPVSRGFLVDMKALAW
jgi:hypothetical protein